MKKSCSLLDILRHQTSPRLRGRTVRAQTLYQTRHEAGHHRNVADQRTEQHHRFRRSREAGPGIYRELELRKGSEDTGKDRRSGAEEGRSSVRESEKSVSESVQAFL